jgi:hypothetical protein
MDVINRINQRSVPTVDGSAGKYSMWWTKFTAFTAISGLFEVIKAEPSPYMPKSCYITIDGSTEEGRCQIVPYL